MALSGSVAQGEPYQGSKINVNSGKARVTGLGDMCQSSRS